MQDYVPKQQKILNELKNTVYNNLKGTLFFYIGFIKVYHKNVDQRLKELVLPDAVPVDRLYSLASFILTSNQEFYIKETNDYRTLDFSPWYHTTDYEIYDVYIRLCLHNHMTPQKLSIEDKAGIIDLTSIFPPTSIKPSKTKKPSQPQIRNFKPDQLSAIRNIIKHDANHMYEWLRNYNVFKARYINTIFPNLLKVIKIENTTINQYCYFYCDIMINSVIQAKTIYFDSNSGSRFDQYDIKWLYTNLCEKFKIPPKFPTQETLQVSSKHNDTSTTNESGATALISKPSPKSPELQKVKVTDYTEYQFSLIDVLITNSVSHMPEWLKNYNVFTKAYSQYILPELLKITRTNFIDPEKYCYLYNVLIARGKDYRNFEYKTKKTDNILCLDFSSFFTPEKYSIRWLYHQLCTKYNISPVFPKKVPNKPNKKVKANPWTIEVNFATPIDLSSSPAQPLSSPTQSHPSGSFVDVLVYSTTHFRCRKPKHQIIDANIFVPVKKTNGEETEIRVPGGYCPNCGTYFIATEDYKHLKLQGQITCRVMEGKSYYESNGGSFLKPESIIFQYGYNVKQSEDLSAKERQDILKTVISDGVLSNHEIRTHLEWLIRSSKSRQGMDLAISKWQEDLKFLRSYKAESNPNYKAASIKHIHYEPR